MWNELRRTGEVERERERVRELARRLFLEGCCPHVVRRKSASRVGIVAGETVWVFGARVGRRRGRRGWNESKR